MISSHICFKFLDCNCSHVRMIASHLIFCFWTAIVHTYEQLRDFFSKFVECNCSYVRTIASRLIFHFLNLWTAIVRKYKQLQAISFLIFDFWSAIIRMYERLQVISYFVFGLQSFAHTNNCKPCFFFNLWSAIVHPCKSSHILFFEFVDCNCSCVRTIASHLILNFPTCCAIVCMYESLLFERSEGMD
jgi:hypothetical protein